MKYTNQTIQNFLNNENKALWIYGKSGYGKTHLAKNIAGDFKNTCHIDSMDLINLYVNLKQQGLSEKDVVLFYKKYDLLILDHVYYSLHDKPATQKGFKEIIQLLTKEGKIKVVLISNKRPRNLKRLKFDSKDCFYLGLKDPTLDYKTKALKQWLEETNRYISKNSLNEIAQSTNNLFKLKGLLNTNTF
jgi:chromosomal replication initiation ATPase DnaA